MPETRTIHEHDTEPEPPLRKPPVIVATAEEEEDEPEEVPPLPEQTAPEEDGPSDEERFPAWAKVPEGLKIPAGYDLWFVPLWERHMAKKIGCEEVTLRDGTKRRCRQVILWQLSIGDRRLAFKRANGDPNQASDELAMQMIRAVDGVPVTWANMKSVAYPPRIWADMGPKYRDLLAKVYAAAHVLSDEAMRDFFANCVEVRKAAST